MALQDEIERARQTIRSESYSMSVGEIINLYNNNEIVISPEYQRLFRWTERQKSRLIESLLLGIPLPPIFVMQRHDGVWEVIDGLQRLSTILEFVGDLRDAESGELRPPSTLIDTEYLPSLSGSTFAEGSGTGEFTVGQRIALKRAKLGVNILLPESDERSQYELFDRLNSGGAIATAQEIRNAKLIMRDKSMVAWLEDLKRLPAFQATIAISDRLYQEGYDAELVYRFVSILRSAAEERANVGNMDEFLTRKMFSLAEDDEFDRARVGQTFSNVFEMIESAAGDDAFRRFDVESTRFKGAFSVSAYEAIAIGLAENEATWMASPTSDRSDLVLSRIKSLWQVPDFRAGSGSGIAASTRIARTIPAAIAHFSQT